MDPLLFYLIIITVILVVQIALLASFYRRCPPNKIIVVFGSVGVKGGGPMKYRIVDSGAVLVWPVIQSYEMLDLSPFKISFDAEDVTTSNYYGEKLVIEFTVKISSEEKLIDKAIENLIGLDETGVTEIVSDLIRSVFLLHSYDVIDKSDRKQMNEINEVVDAKLKSIGVSTIGMTIS